MSADAASLMDELVGSEVESVVFVRDYLQLALFLPSQVRQPAQPNGLAAPVLAVDAHDRGDRSLALMPSLARSAATSNIG